MQTKLTLRMDSELIEGAKAFAKTQGKSVSAIVAGYFALLKASSKRPSERPTPLSDSLLGVLGDSDLDETAYRTHLEKKYL